MIEIARRVPNAGKIAAWLDQAVRGHLRPDVSRYAAGRMRAWLNVEPSLTSPTTFSRGVPVGEKVWDRLKEVTGLDFDYCLATYSGDESPIGITPHRDAGFAEFEAWGLNVSGECEFRYWMTKESFGRSRDTLPETESPTHTLVLKPGDLVRFNCKNRHAATPGTGRWNLNFWRAKP